MKYGVILVAAAAVRRKPNHRAEMVNQLLFGEAVQVLKKKDLRWLKVRSLHDKYEGWITNSHLQEVDKSEAFSPVNFITKDFGSTITINSHSLFLPAGSSLRGYHSKKGTIGPLNYSFKGNTVRRPETPKPFDADFPSLKAWLEVPYLWGGRTPMGIDCSGFIQIIYGQLGLSLPRDAWEQQEQGTKIKSIKEAEAGDVIFFQNEYKRIVHVGIYLGESQIMHASGKVRIDKVEKKRIIHGDTGEKGWKIHSIKRLF